MAFYYPLSQVKTNLYTNGGEYMTQGNNEEYVGYYYEVSTGKKYVGKVPNPNSTILLLPLTVEDKVYEDATILGKTIIYKPNFDTNDPSISKNSMEINEEYNLLTSNKNLTNPRLMPSPYYSFPNENDEKEGSYVRYFAKRNTNFMYLEISKDVYSKLKAKDPSYDCELYECIKLPWSLILNDDAINRGEIERIEKQKNWFNFKAFFQGNYSAPSKPESVKTRNNKRSKFKNTTRTSTLTPNTGFTSTSSPSGGGGSGY